MKYSRTAIGLLTAQYRSVLKKCLLINLGLYALGAVAATPANATTTISTETTVEEGLSGQNLNGQALTLNPKEKDSTGKLVGITDMGIYYNTSVLHLADGLTFSGNFAPVAGGVVYNSGTLDVGDNVTFDNNRSRLDGRNEVTKGSSEMGAAIYSEGTKDSMKTVTIGDGVKFTNNSADGGSALFFFGNNNVTVGNNVEFSGNTANHGGALKILHGNYAGLNLDNGKTTMTIGSGAKFTNNTAAGTSPWGAAISIENEPNSLTIGENALFSGNSGAQAIFNYGILTVGSGAVFEKNKSGTSGSAQYGGALMSGGTSSFTNVTATNNIAYGVGGFAWVAAGTTTIDGGSFTGNATKGNGGAIYNQATLNLKATNQDLTFSGNKAGATITTDNAGNITGYTGGTANDIYNVGTLNFDASAGRIISLAGGITGSKSNIASHIMNVTGAGTVKVANKLQNQTVNNTGNLVLDGADLTGTTITGSGAVKVEGDSVIEGNNEINSNIQVEAGKELEIKNATITTTASGKLTNAAGGVLNIKDSTIKVAVDNFGVLYSDPTTYEGTVTNAADAYASFDNDTFASTATLANAGTVDLKNGVTFDAGATITGAGITNLVNGTTHFNNTVNSNTIYLAKGAHFDGTINGGTLDTRNNFIDSSLGSYTGSNLYVDADLTAGTIDAVSGAIKKVTLINATYGTAESVTLNSGSSTFADDVAIEGMNYYTKVEKDTSGNLVFSDKLVNTSTIRGKGDGSTTFTGDVVLGDKAATTTIGTTASNIALKHSTGTVDITGALTAGATTVGSLKFAGDNVATGITKTDTETTTALSLATAGYATKEANRAADAAIVQSGDDINFYNSNSATPEATTLTKAAINTALGTKANLAGGNNLYGTQNFGKDDGSTFVAQASINGETGAAQFASLKLGETTVNAIVEPVNPSVPTADEQTLATKAYADTKIAKGDIVTNWSAVQDSTGTADTKVASEKLVYTSLHGTGTNDGTTVTPAGTVELGDLAATTQVGTAENNLTVDHANNKVTIKAGDTDVLTATSTGIEVAGDVKATTLSADNTVTVGDFNNTDPTQAQGVQLSKTGTVVAKDVYGNTGTYSSNEIKLHNGASNKDVFSVDADGKTTTTTLAFTGAPTVVANAIDNGSSAQSIGTGGISTAQQQTLATVGTVLKSAENAKYDGTPVTGATDSTTIKSAIAETTAKLNGVLDTTDNTKVAASKVTASWGGSTTTVAGALSSAETSITNMKNGTEAFSALMFGTNKITGVAIDPATETSTSYVQIASKGYVDTKQAKLASSAGNISATVRTDVRALATASDQEIVTEKGIAAALDNKLNKTLAGTNAVLVTDGSGNIGTSTVTSTELGYLAGTTSAVLETNDIVTSTAGWSSALSDSKVASEKLVKNALDTKLGTSIDDNTTITVADTKTLTFGGTGNVNFANGLSIGSGKAITFGDSSIINAIQASGKVTTTTGTKAVSDTALLATLDDYAVKNNTVLTGTTQVEKIKFGASGTEFDGVDTTPAAANTGKLISSAGVYNAIHGVTGSALTLGDASLSTTVGSANNNIKLDNYNNNVTLRANGVDAITIAPGASAGTAAISVNGLLTANQGISVASGKTIAFADGGSISKVSSAITTSPASGEIYDAAAVNAGLDKITNGTTKFTGLKMDKMTKSGSTSVVSGTTTVNAIDDGNYSDNAATTLATNATIKAAIDNEIFGGDNVWTGTNEFQNIVSVTDGTTTYFKVNPTTTGTDAGKTTIASLILGTSAAVDGVDTKPTLGNTTKLITSDGVYKDVHGDGTTVSTNTVALGDAAVATTIGNTSGYHMLLNSAGTLTTFGTTTKYVQLGEGTILMTDAVETAQYNAAGIALNNGSANTFTVDTTDGNTYIAGDVKVGAVSGTTLTTGIELDNAGTMMAKNTTNTSTYGADGIAMNTNKFTVDAANGDMTAAGGNFAVSTTGTTTTVAITGNENVTGNITVQDTVTPSTAKVEIKNDGSVLATDGAASGAKTVELKNGAAMASESVTAGSITGAVADKGVQMTKNGTIKATDGTETAQYNAAGITLNKGITGAAPDDTFTVDSTNGDMMAAAGNFTVTTTSAKTTAAVTGNLTVTGKSTFGTGANTVEIDNGTVTAANGVIAGAVDGTGALTNGVKLGNDGSILAKDASGNKIFEVTNTGTATVKGSLSADNGGFSVTHNTTTDKTDVVVSGDVKAGSFTISTNTVNAIDNGSSAQSIGTGGISTAQQQTLATVGTVLKSAENAAYTNKNGINTVLASTDTTIGAAINKIDSVVSGMSNVISMDEYNAWANSVKASDYTGNISHHNTTAPAVSPTLISAIEDLDTAIGDRSAYNNTHYANATAGKATVSDAIKNLDTAVYQDIHGKGTAAVPDGDVKIGDLANKTTVGSAASNMTVDTSATAPANNTIKFNIASNEVLGIDKDGIDVTGNITATKDISAGQSVYVGDPAGQITAMYNTGIVSVKDGTHQATFGNDGAWVQKGDAQAGLSGIGMWAEKGTNKANVSNTGLWVETSATQNTSVGAGGMFTKNGNNNTSVGPDGVYTTNGTDHSSMGATGFYTTKDVTAKGALSAENGDFTVTNDGTKTTLALKGDANIDGNENVTGNITVQAAGTAPQPKVEIKNDGSVKTTDATGAKTVELKDGVMTATDKALIQATGGTTKVEIDNTGKITSKGANHDVVINNGDVDTYSLTMANAEQPSTATSTVKATVKTIDIADSVQALDATYAVTTAQKEALATVSTVLNSAENAKYRPDAAITAGTAYATVNSKTLNQAIRDVDLRIGDWNDLNKTYGNLTNGHAGDAGYNDPTTVVATLNNIDATLGRIHGLVVDNGDGTVTYNATDSSKAGIREWTNLAKGTTVEEHILAVDTAIGNRNQYSQEYNIAKDDAVADSLEKIDLRMGDVASLGREMHYYQEKNPADVNLSSAVKSLDSNLYRLEMDHKKLRHETHAGLASAAALSALVPNPRGTGDTTLSFGTGAYQGHTAAAFGGFHWITNNLLVNAGVGWDNREATTRIGVSYSF